MSPKWLRKLLYISPWHCQKNKSSSIKNHSLDTEIQSWVIGIIRKQEFWVYRKHNKICPLSGSSHLWWGYSVATTCLFKTWQKCNSIKQHVTNQYSSIFSDKFAITRIKKMWNQKETLRESRQWENLYPLKFVSLIGNYITVYVNT